jgi:hypothetical protein
MTKLMVTFRNFPNAAKKKPNQLLLYRDMIAFYIRTGHINTLCEQNVGLCLNFETASTEINHRTLKS